ncbi:hypothetical protein [Streptacidiphilus jiangxiensis]|uniref:Integral membrane protein n=1 Tax=Streptacidiphilus jiangxiensis TaxID=235985 RepID=A0A1H7XMZ1_STRJI|nr:hypothetical protein [Streptacidiphilus jiangxiensis]SEM35111.1 hypothetical protein SAMN05414137_124124 [Streptacidiphilus jiangxiensis]
MDGFGIRLLRAAVFAALSVLLPTGARLAVTGEPVPVDVALLAFGGCLLTALVVFRGERRYGAIALTMLPLQLAMNALFNAGQQSCPPTSGTGPALHGWNVLACGGGSIRPGLLGLTEQAPRALIALTGGQALLLLALHLLLALAAAWWLRRGEAALSALLGAAALTLRPALRPGVRALLRRLAAPLALPEAPPCPPVTSRRPTVLGPQDALPRTAPRRGPPALARAC